jgi:predicted nucleic acid-binding protein
LIVVDTSVWVAALRGRDRPTRAALETLLDADEVALAAPVRIEILGGARKADQPRLRRVLSALPVLYPGEPTWALMESWIQRAASRGERFGVADLLIAALAAERGHAIWSLDADFARMSRLGFVAIHRPMPADRGGSSS